MPGNAAQELCANDPLLSLVERFSSILSVGREPTSWLLRLRKGALKAFEGWVGAFRNDSDLLIRVVETYAHAGADSRYRSKQ